MENIFMLELLKLTCRNKKIIKKHKRLKLSYCGEEMFLLHNLQHIQSKIRRKRVMDYLSKLTFPIPRQQNFVENIIPEFTDKEFKSHFRMMPSTFHILLNKLLPFLTRESSGAEMLPAAKQLYIALWKMANPETYRSVCIRFGVSYAGALLSVRRVTAGLIALARSIITWPTKEKMIEIAREFEAISGFPNVIGAIDSTHIYIRASKENPECYINRKGRHSVILQAVCDNTTKFIHCYCGEVGSVHDQRVFRLSEVSEYLGDPEKFPGNFHMVGDPAYTLDEHLMVPYRNNGQLTPRQENFNFCLSSARLVIERAFGLLKNRFRSINEVLNMKRVDLIPEYIMACCVLHNICLMNNDELDINCEETMNNERLNSTDEMAQSKRDRILNSLPMRINLPGINNC